MTDATTIVTQVYSAFGAGDGERLAQLLADTRWEEAEGMPYGGVYRGFDEIAANVFGPIGRDVEGFSAKPDETVAVGTDRVLARGTYRGRGASGELAAPFAHLWTVSGDGRISHFVQYADTHLFRQAIGS